MLSGDVSMNIQNIWLTYIRTEVLIKLDYRCVTISEDSVKRLMTLKPKWKTVFGI